MIFITSIALVVPNMYFDISIREIRCNVILKRSDG